MLCAEDEQSRTCWMTAFRLLKVGDSPVNVVRINQSVSLTPPPPPPMSCPLSMGSFSTRATTFRSRGRPASLHSPRLW